ncbi:MAG: SDR family NAD(P)-dependent oxidoreductase, partial [Polyangiaceae bacterium]
MRASQIAKAALAAALLARFAWKRFRRRSVKDTSVVITGGSRGLGLELARAFGERGARIAISARSKEELERALDDLRFRGIEAYPFVCDLTDREATREFIAGASRRLGGIDVLINNAGRIEVGPYETMTEEDFQSEICFICM